MSLFEGYALTPGHHDEFFTQESQVTWGRWDQQKVYQALLDKDTVDSGNGTDTTKLRPGLALGKITASGQLTHWNPYATDGSDQLVGFFLENLDMGYFGTTKERLIYCLVGGNIRASAIIIPGGDEGIDGVDYEYILRQACASRFLFDDDLNVSQTEKFEDVAGATKTVTVDDLNTHYINEAGGTLALQLPAPVPGIEYKVTNTHATENITVDGPTGDEFLIAGATASSEVIYGGNYETITFKAVLTATDTYQYIVYPVPAAS